MLDIESDPSRQAHGLRWRIYLLATAAFILVAPVYALTLSLSLPSALLLLALSLVVIVGTVESVSRYNYRMRMRIGYPHMLGVTLAPVRDFSQACTDSVAMVGNWLHADAAVIAWLSDDGDYLHPLGAYGMPPDWVETAPRIAIGSRSLRHAVEQGGIFKPSTIGDPWFSGFHLNHQVIYLPLVNRDVALGVLAITGNTRKWELHDQRLLSSLGMVMAIALDNICLSQGERERARHMQQLAQMKSSFLTVVSHELRTPLTSIKTAAEMLLEDAEQEDPDSATARLARNIVRGAARLNAMVADLMETAKQDELAPRLEMDLVNLGEVAANSVAVIYPLIMGKDQKIEVSFKSPGPIIFADRSRLEQIFVNLLSNANRFTPLGGRILLEIQEDSREATVSVADSGPGVALEERERIFEPFYRGDRSGMGMGLAIAKAITEMHRGRIWIDANENGGSVFRVALPLYESELRVETSQPQSVVP